MAAHQGVEIKQLPGVGMGEKAPQPAASANVAANGASKPPEIRPGPPPVLTRRGADVLVQLEKMLDDAAKADKTSTNEPSKPAKPLSSSSLALPENVAAAAAPDNVVPSVVPSPSRKN
jgi:penicillin-binding protein 1A